MRFNLTSKITIFVIVSSIAKLILSAVSYHPDIRAFDLAGFLLGKGNILNLYDYLFSLSSSDLLRQNYPVDFFIYPPAIYLSHGLVSLMTNLLVPESFRYLFLTQVSQTFQNPWLFLHLMLLKAPYLFFDIGAAYFLSKLFTEDKLQKLAFILWLINPVNIYATYLMGQFDIIPTFLVILALSYLRVQDGLKKRIYLAAFILGLGAAFKIFPLFFILPLSFLVSKWDRLKIIAIGIIPYAFLLLPFLFSQGFRSSALVANHTLKSFYAQIPISGGESIILFLLAIVFFYLYLISGKVKLQNIWQIFFIILIFFFTFTHYHPQWFLWITPFLIIDYVLRKRVEILILSLVSFFGLVTFFDTGLTFGLFTPLFPDLQRITNFWNFFGFNFDLNYSRSVLQTVFVACGVYYLYLYFPRRLNE